MGFGGAACQEERAADICRYRQVGPTPQAALQSPPSAPGIRPPAASRRLPIPLVSASLRSWRSGRIADVETPSGFVRDS